MSRKTTILSWGQLRYFEIVMAIKRHEGQRVELSDLVAIYAERKRKQREFETGGGSEGVKFIQVEQRQ